MNQIISIGYKFWTYEVLEDSVYILRFGVDNDGMCIQGPKQIFFRESALTAGLIRHELFHAFMYEVPIHSANLDMDQTLEVVAEWSEENLEPYVDACSIVIKKLLGKKETTNDAAREEIRSGEGAPRPGANGSHPGNSQGTSVRSQKV